MSFKEYKERLIRMEIENRETDLKLKDMGNYYVCEDCFNEDKKIEPETVKDMGQWTYLIECPNCHRTDYWTDYIAEMNAMRD